MASVKNRHPFWRTNVIAHPLTHVPLRNTQNL